MPNAQLNGGSLPPTLSQWMEHDDDDDDDDDDFYGTLVYLTCSPGFPLSPTTNVPTGHWKILSYLYRADSADLHGQITPVRCPE